MLKRWMVTLGVLAAAVALAGCRANIGNFFDLY